MTIQWFPGHMAKANRELKENLGKIDVVIELVDARLPQASRNPMLNETAAGKPRVIAMMKTDLADPEVTKAWHAFFEERGETVVNVNAKHGKGLKDLLNTAVEVGKQTQARLIEKGVSPRAPRAMVIGVPNVGKSTLINQLINKKTANIGDTPGVTRQQQWLKVNQNLDLLDTPGILWPKFEYEDVGNKLALVKAIKEERFIAQDVALFLINILKERYPELLKDRYKLDEIPEDGVELFEAIGLKRGCLIRKGDVDFEKAAGVVLTDFRNEKLGKISLETPNDWKERLTEESEA
ncbi:Ras superfamily GTP-binding protein YlqF [Salsuginibacillus halophilus]|uniref:Ribosome biogenesis GTPase A n=1 Tax=Salsuginibacillus halophilus TaxID=517424 RepID=A0A2P8HY48_9BACI|nr:ribosome biogenesis GTPase YlqF [Salsuginibacillus halophilus]PSL51171.1 Ras superfamily GTP-binding protein YlqF [Salsuginibacillus halophilus]